MAADAPRFSVTVPAFNAEATLAETVASVRAQTFADWELVIVDDGSADGTRALAERLAAADPRVRVVAQANRGSGGAYNTAVRHARAGLLVMLSADDLLLPDHLAEVAACVDGHPDASVFTCDGWYAYPDGWRERARPAERWADPAGCTLTELLQACFYGVGAVYRREVFEAVGGFHEDMYAEDYLFWLLALAHGFTHRHIDRPLSVHRLDGVQKSANALLMRETDLRVLDEVMASGLLCPQEMAAARRSAARLRRAIAARRALEPVIGPEALERLAALTRRLRQGGAWRRGAASLRPGAAMPGGTSVQSRTVVFVNNFAGPSLGGGEVQLLGLLRGLPAERIRPVVVCAAGSALELEARRLEGVVVVPARFDLGSLPSLVGRIAADLPDGRMVQGTGFLTGIVARCAGAWTHVPVVNAVHVIPGAARLDGESHLVSAVRRLLDRITRRYVTRYVAVSEAVRAGLIADGVDPARIAVIPNGVDLAALQRAAAAPPAVKLPRADGRVGCLGRLEPVKGTEYFLRAAALVSADHPQVRFVVAGRGSCAHALKDLAAKLGVAGLVDFVGYVDSAPALLKTLDVVVVPSLSEASGLTAMEAMALGVPVVATEVGGLSEVVENGATGLLVPPADEQALARAVTRLLENPELSRRFSAEGVCRAHESFGVERMIAAYLRLYEELADLPPACSPRRQGDLLPK